MLTTLVKYINGMNYADYFTSPPEVQAMMRRATLRQLEDIFIYELTGDDYEDIPFETFLDRTIQDMLVVENYEGVQVLKDIKKYQGWR